jgi:hypothetical protein
MAGADAVGVAGVAAIGTMIAGSQVGEALIADEALRGVRRVSMATCTVDFREARTQDSTVVARAASTAVEVDSMEAVDTAVVDTLAADTAAAADTGNLNRSY